MKLFLKLKVALFVSSLLFYSHALYSQTHKAKNALYVEIGGNAYLYSLNYERIVYQKNSVQVGARVGVSVFPESSFNEVTPIPLLPLEVLALFGKNNHHFETGIGVTPFLTHEYYDGARGSDYKRRALGAATSIRVGYRYQKPNGGFMARVGIMPILNLEGYLIPWAGISIGKNF